MKLITLHDVDQALEKYALAMTRSLRKEASLVPARKLMQLLGNAQLKLPVIHVAGTSGKTSTTHYIASLLMAGGYKVGHTESPHVSHVNERVQINLEPIPGAQFAARLGEYLKIIEASDLEPSYFEVLIGFAYWMFEREKVDWAVIETGLGGTFDATNVADQSSKICVITDIGLDHTAILGDTLEQIAHWKAGIIHAGNEVYMLEQSPEVTAVFAKRAQEVGANLYVISEAGQATLREKLGAALQGLPLFQQRNAVLAFAAVRNKLVSLSDQQLADALHIAIPGRMEIRKLKAGQKLILDGAHNPQKMEALARALQAEIEGSRVALMVGMKDSKDYETALQNLVEIADYAIATEFSMQQDMPIRAVPAEHVGRFLTDAGIATQVVSDYRQALEALLARPEKVLLVTGSIYLIGHVKQMLEQ